MALTRQQRIACPTRVRLLVARALMSLFCLQLAAKEKKKDEPTEPRIVRVHCGDTFDAITMGRRRLGLIGIDAPEEGQPLAAEAREQLVKILNDPGLRYERKKGDEFDRLAAINKLAGSIIIPKLECDDKPVSEVLADLAELAKEKDPKGIGFKCKITLTKPPPPPPIDNDEDGAWKDDDDDNDDVVVEQAGPTITMHFSNIPLREAFRYICEGAGLFFQLTPDGVVVTDARPGFQDLPASFKVSLYTPKQKATASYLMLRSGLAWYVKDDNLDPATAKALQAAEALAKKEKLGIWGLKAKPTPPWEYRAKKKAEAAKTPNPK